MDYLDLGVCPSDETPVQAPYGSRSELAYEEAKRYKTMLEEKFPAPEGVIQRFSVKSNPYDYFHYYSVVLRFEDNHPESIEYAYFVEENLPYTWEDKEIMMLDRPQVIGYKDGGKVWLDTTSHGTYQLWRDTERGHLFELNTSDRHEMDERINKLFSNQWREGFGNEIWCETARHELSYVITGDYLVFKMTNRQYPDVYDPRRVEIYIHMVEQYVDVFFYDGDGRNFASLFKLEMPSERWILGTGWRWLHKGEILPTYDRNFVR